MTIKTRNTKDTFVNIIKTITISVGCDTVDKIGVSLALQAFQCVGENEAGDLGDSSDLSGDSVRQETIAWDMGHRGILTVFKETELSCL